MDKTIAGLLGAIGALAVGTPGQAAPVPAPAVLQAATYAELLQPIPDALATLRAVDAQAPASVEDVQYYYGYPPPPPPGYYWRHHHHHHGYYRRFRRHHHHHHHHHGYGRY